MLSSNSLALKEWAVVCAALAVGRQCLILRKGGIQEEQAGFALEGREFWLLPTWFHQQTAGLAPGTEHLVEWAIATRPPEGRVCLPSYAVVEEVYEATDAAGLDRIAELHILARETVWQRFQYRRAGLWVLALRVFNRQSPHAIHDEPRFAGCRSWLQLGQPLPVDQLVPAVDDTVHRGRMEQIGAALRATTLRATG